MENMDIKHEQSSNQVSITQSKYNMWTTRMPYHRCGLQIMMRRLPQVKMWAKHKLYHKCWLYCIVRCCFVAMSALHVTWKASRCLSRFITFSSTYARLYRLLHLPKAHQMEQSELPFTIICRKLRWWVWWSSVPNTNIPAYDRAASSRAWKRKDCCHCAITNNSSNACNAWVASNTPIKVDLRRTLMEWWII